MRPGQGIVTDYTNTQEYASLCVKKKKKKKKEKEKENTYLPNYVKRNRQKLKLIVREKKADGKQHCHRPNVPPSQQHQKEQRFPHHCGHISYSEEWQRV
jgi:hypothetical protein